MEWITKLWDSIDNYTEWKGEGRNTTRQPIPAPRFVFRSVLLFAEGLQVGLGLEPATYGNTNTQAQTIKSRLQVVHILAATGLCNPTRGRPPGECVILFSEKKNSVRQRAYWLVDWVWYDECALHNAGDTIDRQCTTARKNLLVDSTRQHNASWVDTHEEVHIF
jgi:hypothetical protein